ncbi:lytic murein transglycosylase [Chelatococcus asaccharovorans]|uniref:Lytic murein transglycosylase n=2 Tax=Chelatococcus asaccharovorans TaxID=28210 RepID=A0A2V3U9W3_9HYPH|nr:lytic murein transglycosylase [Chelatococcus asaccharovorans]
MKTMFRATATALLLAAATLSSAWAAPCSTRQPFEAWLADVKSEAHAAGVTPRGLAALDGLTYDPQIVARDRGQGVFQQSFLQFSDRMVSADRLLRGGRFLKSEAATFDHIARTYGVPGPVIVAFWGLETDFGAVMGNMSTLRSLATLAYDCRRPAMFRAELIDALKIIDRGDLKAADMRGAWAGELGQFQFMPSYYLKYAVDEDGDGRRDLLRSRADALASAGNFLASLGWRRGEAWLREVRVPDTLDWKQADLAIKHPVSVWANWGVTLPNGSALPAEEREASLHLPMGRLGPAFLAYDNFQVFLKWNQSLVYATTAAYLADRLAGAPPISRGRGRVTPLNAQDTYDLQRLLSAKGWDPGPIDGKLGTATRTAVREAQGRFGLPADSYPSQDLLEALRRN